MAISPIGKEFNTKGKGQCVPDVATRTHTGLPSTHALDVVKPVTIAVIAS